MYLQSKLVQIIHVIEIGSPKSKKTRIKSSLSMLVLIVRINMKKWLLNFTHLKTHPYLRKAD